jgi:dTDP-4-dehydrorhamnose 3,5-epimerase
MSEPAARSEFISSTITGVLLVQRTCVEDHRGFLCRLYSADAFEGAGIRKTIVQINHSLTRRAGAVRGMHFQRPPHAETKLVSCIRGEIFDVALDLRKHSPTFLRWHGEVISAANRRSVLIPEGVAHGFQAMTDDSEVLYLHSARYEPAAEGGLSPVDPRLAIQWPRQITEMSERDRHHALIEAAFEGIDL